MKPAAATSFIHSLSKNQVWKSFVSHFNLLTWDRGLWVRFFFVFDGRVPQGVVGKRVQERCAADANTDAGHTDSKRVCAHRGSAWPPLPDVVQYCEGTTVRCVRLKTKPGMLKPLKIQMVVDHKIQNINYANSLLDIKKPFCL